MTNIAVNTLVYQRPERLAKTLTMLENQTTLGFGLYVINNNPGLTDHVNRLCADCALPVQVQHNEHNTGCKQQVLSGLDRAREGYHYIITLDDDIDIEPHTIAQLIAQAQPTTLVGAWGWRFEADYWTRSEVEPGQSADYIPGRLCIAPNAVYDLGIVDLEEQYSPAADLWQSYYASHVNGIELRRGIVSAETVEDGKDHYVHHIEMKRQFLESLRADGWQV